MTCENYQPGSFGYEEAHLTLFDQWGVDMLKYDFCNSEAAAKVSYQAMGAAVQKVNETRQQQGNTTPFSFNICEWGNNQPWLWGAEAGGCSWRATQDARESWIGTHTRPGVLGGVDEVRQLWMYAGVNRFNDLDMMCIGLHGLGGSSNNTHDHQVNGGKIAGLTPAQARTQMALWCMLSSPLAVTADLRPTPKGEANKVSLPNPLITEDDVKTLTNRLLIAINQDEMGQQAEYMPHLGSNTNDFATAGHDVYVKDLSGGRKAIAIINRGNAQVASFSLDLAKLYLDANTSYQCQDVWTESITNIKGTLTTGDIPAYETKVFILSSLPTAVHSLMVSTAKQTPIYDLTGRRTAKPAHGIYLQAGKKVMQ